MASDEVVWQVIGQQFCSFKLKTSKDQTFCRNENNVTGFCSRQACPLANSRYATVRADPNSGTLYLYMKTIERAHMPAKLWERIKLSQNYATALAQLDERLIYWPKFLLHKCKQRLTRLTQVAIRMRRVAKEEARLGEKVVTRLAPKIRKREAGRERKAEAAAKVEREIERELLERLKSGVYGEQPLNVDGKIWQRVLRGLEREGMGVRDVDEDEDEMEDEIEGEIEGEETGMLHVEYVSDMEESEGELDDLEDWLGDTSDEGESQKEDDEDSEEEEEVDIEATGKAKTNQDLKRKRPAKGPTKPQKKGPRVDVKYETDNLQQPVVN
ncbi:MAG: hypothetical protein M1814_004827 [Vezdaea aestivalis]|nr:MAG: hypothetical protein M1814_004827 [Vezdaea aestivalis]